jgi:transcriptional regulator with XRE-family HTH domain
MSVGKNVKRYREENGLNQTELAEKVNISQAMIARIENETKLPSVVILKNIADVLHCSMDELVN